MKKIFVFTIFVFLCVYVFSQNDENRPTLVVGIVVDQLRYDLLIKYWNKFEETGFKKLATQGTFCKNAHYDYININSASGYATIACGSYPSQHGIINKTWYERLSQKEIYCVEDKNYSTVGSKYGVGKSPNNIISTTWTDQLKLSTFKMSKVYSVGFNDYASIISGGKLADAAYWFDENTGNWVTSSYYKQDLDKWVYDFNEKKFGDIYLERSWQTTLPLESYVESLADATAYEIGLAGQTTFPYVLTTLKNKFTNYSILKYTPYANSLTKDFAINLLMNLYLGKDPYTDVLLVNFAATSYVSDLFGIQSVELEDAYLKLDKDISHLIAAVESYVGKNNVIFYLTSDRGACDNTQWLNDINIAVGEFNQVRSGVVTNSFLRAVYGMGNWVDGVYNNEMYLNHFEIDKAKLNVDDLQEKASQLVIDFSGVSYSIATASLLKGTYSSGIMKQAQNSFFSKRSGDIFIILDFGWRFVDEQKTSISACNSCYNENKHVPIIFYGANIPKNEIYRQISVDDLAATLSFILNISLPNKCTGQPIQELMKF